MFERIKNALKRTFSGFSSLDLKNIKPEEQEKNCLLFQDFSGNPNFSERVIFCRNIFGDTYL